MLAAAAGVLAACDETTPGASNGTRLKVLALHQDGIGVVDLGRGDWLVPPAPAALPPDHRGLATTHGGDLAVWRLSDGQRTAVADLDGAWTPRAVIRGSVALIQGDHGSAIYEPVGRSTTKIMITGHERRFDLPGNLEPEAFSPDGSRLYLLDYLPPEAPDIYRVRVLDLATGQIHPLATRAKKAIPAGAEETMRGRGRHAVYDPANGILFTLYTHQPDHRHTGELLGVRPGAPDVHAFIHALHLGEGWAFCIDLPEPFGRDSADGHTLVLSAKSPDLMFAVSAAHGVVAEIDRRELTVKNSRSIPAMAGSATGVSTADGALMLAVGARLTDTATTWTLPAPAGGLVAGPDGLLWTCLDGKITGLEWASRTLKHETSVPGLRSVLGVV